MFILPLFFSPAELTGWSRKLWISETDRKLPQSFPLRRISEDLRLFKNPVQFTCWARLSRRCRIWTSYC